MASEWLYFKNGQQVGPVGTAQLKHLAGTGELSPGDLVWREGMAEWIAASEVKGLFVEGAMEASGALASSTVAAPLEYYSPSSAWGTRAALTLKGFPPPMGKTDHWPLSEEDLRALAKAELSRKRIRTLSGLFHLLCVLGGFLSAWMMIGLILASMRGSSISIVGALMFLILLGQTVLWFFSARANSLCRLWPSIIWMILFSLSALVNVGYSIYGMNFSRSSGDEIVLPLVIAAVDLVFVYLCVAAYSAIPRFLKCPAWAQEALVNAKL